MVQEYVNLYPVPSSATERKCRFCDTPITFGAGRRGPVPVEVMSRHTTRNEKGEIVQAPAHNCHARPVKEEDE